MRVVITILLVVFQSSLSFAASKKFQVECEATVGQKKNRKYTYTALFTHTNTRGWIGSIGFKLPEGSSLDTIKVSGSASFVHSFGRKIRPKNIYRYNLVTPRQKFEVLHYPAYGDVKENCFMFHWYNTKLIKSRCKIISEK